MGCLECGQLRNLWWASGRKRGGCHKLCLKQHRQRNLTFLICALGTSSHKVPCVLAFCFLLERVCTMLFLLGGHLKRDCKSIPCFLHWPSQADFKIYLHELLLFSRFVAEPADGPLNNAFVDNTSAACTLRLRRHKAFPTHNIKDIKDIIKSIILIVFLIYK